MILPIYNLAYDVQDFERLGNYTNYRFGLQVCPDSYLLPFKVPNVAHTTNSITEFSLRRISIDGTDKTILETTSLSTALITIVSGDVYDYYYYSALTEIATDLCSGVYEYYIKDNNDAEFISELFLIKKEDNGEDYPLPLNGIYDLTYDETYE